MVIAPRHIERAAEIMDLCRKEELRVTQRTKANPEKMAQVVVLDTIGELGRIYGIADLVFVGGSLVPKGGHNILEPAAHGKPVLVGPHMFNFKEIYALLSKRGVCFTVKDQQDLNTRMNMLLKDEKLRQAVEREALQIINENKGASVKSAQFVKQLLQME